MKRLLIALALLVSLGAANAPAQRVSVSIDIGAPFVVYQPRYHRTPYIVYHSRVYRPRPALIVVAPRAYGPARVVVVRPRHHPRRHRRR